jgi:peptide deformylase
VPGFYGLVSRPSYVKVRAFDRNGNVFEADGEGLTARAFCHEIDHLNGLLYTELADQLMTPEELEEYYETHAEDGEEELDEKPDGEND